MKRKFFFLREAFCRLEYAENAFAASDFAPDPTGYGGTHDALPNPLVDWERTPLPNPQPQSTKEKGSIGSASEYGLEYSQNAFVNSDKNIVGSVVHAAELNLKMIFSFHEKRPVA